MANGFKYIISAEVNLSPSSIKKLVEDVKSLDQQIQRSLNVDIQARLNNRAVQSIQRQIGDTKATVSVSLKLDKSSLATLKRDIDTVINNAKREIEVALSNNNIAHANNVMGAAPNAPRISGVNRNGMPRITPTGANDRDIRAYNAETRRAAVLVKQGNQVSIDRINAEKALAQVRKQQLDETKMETEQERKIGVQLLNAERDARKRLAEMRLTKFENKGKIDPNDKEKLLLDPKVSAQQKQRIMKDLDQHYANLSKMYGTKFTKSFSISDTNSDGSISRLRTTQKYYDNGESFDKANKSLGDMMSNMTKHMAFHVAIAAGFYKISEAAIHSVETMKEFESEFVKVQNLAQSRQSENSNFGITDTKAKQDIFGISKMYGRDAIKDVMPVYMQILRRSDLAGSADDAKTLTQMIIRQGIASLGNDANSEEFNTLTKDVVGISSLMFPQWKSQGANPLRQMNSFFNKTAALSQHGVKIDDLYGALADDLVPLATKEGGTGMSLEDITALTGAFEKKQNISDKEAANVIKTFITNLNKTGGTGVEKYSNILGIQGKPDLSAKDKLDVIKKALGDKGISTAEKNDLATFLLTDGQTSQLALDIASNGGGGGGASRAAPYMALLQSLDEMDNLKGIMSKASPHTADDLAKRSTETMSGLLGKLNSSFQELSVTVGQAGVLDALKGIVKALTAITQVGNFLLSPLARIHDGLVNLNKDLGNFATTIETVVALGLATKGASLAKYTLFGSGEGVASTMFGRFMQKAAISKEASVAKEASVVAGTATTSGVGSAIFNFLGLGMLSSGGKGVITGVAEGFTKLMPALTSFGLLLARLTAWGAIIGAAIAGITMLYSKIQDSLNSKAESFTNELAHNESSRQYISDRFSKLVDLRNNIKGSDSLIQNSQKERDIVKELNNKFPDANFKLSGVFKKNLDFYTQDAAGNRVKNSIALTNDGLKKELNLMDSIRDGISEQDAEYLKITHHLTDHLDIISQIKDLTDDIAHRQSYSSIANSYNDLLFGNESRDTLSYLSNGMGITQNSISGISGKLQNALKTEKIYSDQTVFDQLNVDQTAAALNNPLEADRINKAFAAAIKGGTMDEGFLSQYTKFDQSQDKDGTMKLRAYYAQAKYDQEKNKENLSSARKDLQSDLDFISGQISKYKDLYKQFLDASSGVKVFDAALKSLNTTLSESKVSEVLAVGENDKINAAVHTYGVMAEQTGIYAQQLRGLQSAMNAVKSAHPDQDFSLSTLYNPSPNGLTPEQEQMKNFIDQQNEIKQNYNQSIEALRQQSDAVVDLVMNTEKYKSTWDSVNSRIELSKSIQGQLRDIQTSATIEPIMQQLNQKLFGGTFDAGGYASQQASQRRDQYMSAFEQVSVAIAKYGDDKDKLNQAIAQIQGDLGSQFKNALLDPLKNIINTDFASAASKQMEASNLFKQTADTLKQFVDEELKTIQGIQQSGNTTTPDGNSAPTVLPPDLQKKISHVAFDPMSALLKNHPPYASDSQNSANDSAGALVSSIGGMLTGTQIEGHAQDFIDAAKAFGVDPKILVGLVKAEQNFTNPYGSNNLTGLTSDMGFGDGRMFGANDGQKLPGFATVKDGLMAAAKNLRKYNDAGITDVNDIAKKWVGNNNWVNEASTIGGVVTQLGGKYSPLSADPKNVGNKAIDIQKQDDAAQAKLAAQSLQESLLQGMLSEQVNSLSSNNIQFNLNKAIRDAATKSHISGMWTDYQGGYYDSVVQARTDVANAKYNNYATLAQYKSDLANGTYYNTGTKQYEKLTDNMIQVYKDNISKLEDNSKALEDLSDNLAKTSYWDPRDNNTEAQKQINNVLDELKSMQGTSAVGDKKWYDDLQSLNQMFSQYFTLNKKVSVSQEAFDNTGFGYENLAKLKQLKLTQDLDIMFKQMTDIATVLSKFGEGTNKWYVVLEDAVNVQQKLVDLENKKTELSKQYFELTNKGIYSYVNSRAYTQSRDTYLAHQNTLSSIANYQTNQGSQDQNEQLVNLQIISESNRKVIQQMNDYRDAVVGAFEAGAISLKEYMERLDGLRNLQDEIKTQAVDMASTIQSGFQSALSGALKNGLQGSFTAPLDFVQGIKDQLASSVSSQLSTVVLQQSGLQNVMNGLVQNLVGSVTTGDANKSVNTFNMVDWKKQLDDALSPFLPLIQQITDSAKGIFGILKDETFNAPGGFKIDSYVYEVAKAQNSQDIGNWMSTTPVNQAGSPNAPATPSGNIVLPTKTPSPYQWNPDIVTKPIDPIRTGSLGSPIATTPYNPVKEAIQKVIDLKNAYQGGSIDSSTYNQATHSLADEVRTALGGLKDGSGNDIVSKIGDGIKDALSVDDLKKYLQTADFSSYDMSIGIDGVKTGVGDLANVASSKLDGVIAGLGNVKTAIEAKMNALSSGGSSSYGGSLPSASSGSQSSVSNGSHVNVGGGTTGTVINGTVTTGNYSNVGSNTQVYTAPGIGTFVYNPDSGIALPPGAVRKYHSGGLAGIKNFADPNSLNSDEVQAIMKYGEVALQPGQVSSLAQAFMNGGPSNSGSFANTSDFNVNVNVDGGGDMNNALQQAIQIAVEAAVNAVYRNNRLNNLRTRGVDRANA